MIPRLSILILFLSLPGLGLAQTVYESKSGQGKVYSDRPLPGSKAVELRPLNVVEPVPVPPAPSAGEASREAGAPRQDASGAGASYQSLRVLFPEEGGSVVANDATFEVRLAAEPRLRVERGHAFVLRLNGRTVPGRFTATEIMVPPEFFEVGELANVQRHVLQASIVDASGQILLNAPPVDFQSRFMNVLQRPHGFPPRPRPPIEPTPPPRPAPVIEPAQPRQGARQMDR